MAQLAQYVCSTRISWYSVVTVVTQLVQSAAKTQLVQSEVMTQLVQCVCSSDSTSTVCLKW
jgi:hypothetical protein